MVTDNYYLIENSIEFKIIKKLYQINKSLTSIIFAGNTSKNLKLILKNSLSSKGGDET
jgi:hypothetical protein